MSCWIINLGLRVHLGMAEYSQNLLPIYIYICVFVYVDKDGTDPVKAKYLCSIYNKVFKSKGGLGMHTHSHKSKYIISVYVHNIKPLICRYSVCV
jgi:hypothetical protein